MNTNRFNGMGSLVVLLFVAPALLALEHGPANVDEAAVLGAKIDQLIAERWTEKGIKPTGLADDAEFFRRLFLDLVGRIPNILEIRNFLDDDRPDKRRIWTDWILENNENFIPKDAFVIHFANVYRAMLLAQTTNQQAAFQTTPSLEDWLRQRLKANVGYDQLVRELLTSQPDVRGGTSPAAFFQANESRAENLAASTSRLFLGVKLECAQCHNHPFAPWTRDQFWQLTAFFGDLPQQGRQAPNTPRQVKIPGTEKVVQARYLDGTQPQWQAGVSTQATLVNWLTAAENPYFARAAVNRLWAYFFGIGLVDPIDEMAADNLPSHPALLDELAKQFVAHRYDLKFLIRAITASQAYQRSSHATDPSQDDPRMFARMNVRGMSPEQLFDSITEAMEFRDSSRRTPQQFFGQPNMSPRGEFLAKFTTQDKPTEYHTSILQALFLMNGKFMANATSLENNRMLKTVAEATSYNTSRRIDTLYLVALSRKPRPEESARLIKYVDSGGATGDPKKALADVLWALLNSAEFILNH